MNINKIKKAQPMVLFFLMSLAISISGCMHMQSGTADMTDHGAATVWMDHDAFSPGSITVKVNTTVTWTNKDLWGHTVTSDTGLFDSGKLKKNDTFTHKFTEKGTYAYHCEIHDKMVAKVIVE